MEIHDNLVLLCFVPSIFSQCTSQSTPLEHTLESPNHFSDSQYASVSFLDVEEWQQALKWTLHCLSDMQSQQDVELIMQLLSTEDFRAAYSVYKAVSQQKSRVSPTSPLTVQAEDLCQEVRKCRIKDQPFLENSFRFIFLHMYHISCLGTEVRGAPSYGTQLLKCLIGRNSFSRDVSKFSGCAV